MPEIAPTFRRIERPNVRSDTSVQSFDCSLSSLAQESLQGMEHQLDGVKVRRILRQVTEACTNSPDRLLHTGNLMEGHVKRMEAYERFLINNPDRRGRVTYLQIAPTSRSEVPEYRALSRAVNETLGRINGSLGEPGWVPIQRHQYLSSICTRRPLPACTRWTCHTDARWHEPGRQGIRRGSGSCGPGGLDPFQVCGCSSAADGRTYSQSK
jgi:hypothetical protein